MHGLDEPVELIIIEEPLCLDRGIGVLEALEDASITFVVGVAEEVTVQGSAYGVKVLSSDRDEVVACVVTVGPLVV